MIKYTRKHSGSQAALFSVNQKGLILPAALGLLTIIVVLSTTALFLTSTDLKISGSYKQSEKAFYSAKAGIEEARARLRGSISTLDFAGDPASTSDSWWSAYILTSPAWQTSDDPGYDANYRNYFPAGSTPDSLFLTANSLENGLDYFVKIRHKCEYDAERTGHTSTSSHYYDGDGSTFTHSTSSPGNIIFYGYGNPSSPTTALQFTTPGTTQHKPVDIITSYGIFGDSLKILEAEVVHPPGPVIRSTLYAKGDITGNGSALTVDGNDNCGASAVSLPPVYTLSPSVTALNGTPTLFGTPPTPQIGTDDIDITGYVDNLKEAASIVFTTDRNNETYGGINQPETCYSDTSSPYNVGGLKLSNITGYGILLVKGDLTLGGGFNWNGLVLCTGVLVFNGGGAGINIRGAVLADQTVDINGGIDIRYDSCMIDNCLNNQTLKIINWREIS